MALKNSIDQQLPFKQLTIWDALTIVEPTFCSGRRGALPEQPLPEQLCSGGRKHWVEPYCPSKRKNYTYYRYVWVEGQKLRHRHLPGGDIQNPISNALKEKVESAIAVGESPEAIKNLIQGKVKLK